MTKKETLIIMAMLSAYYGEGKSDAVEMAAAWHAILKDFDFPTTQMAVVNFAKHDTRDYASFPAPGKIVAAIEEETAKRRGVFNAALRGDSWEALPAQYKAITTPFYYNQLLLLGEDGLRERKYDILDNLIPGKLPELEDAYGRKNNRN